MRLRRRHHHGARGGAGVGHVNVTPMIDVVMCLIVFYLIVGKLAADQRSNVPLPVSEKGLTEKPSDHIVINIVPVARGSAESRIVIDTREVPMDGLEAAIRERLGAKPGMVVEIRGSRDLRYGEIARVIRACKEAGVESVRLATERPEGGQP
jgi:biopolymer transport protein ExbD